MVYSGGALSDSGVNQPNSAWGLVLVQINPVKTTTDKERTTVHFAIKEGSVKEKLSELQCEPRKKV